MYSMDGKLAINTEGVPSSAQDQTKSDQKPLLNSILSRSVSSLKTLQRGGQKKTWKLMDMLPTILLAPFTLSLLLAGLSPIPNH